MAAQTGGLRDLLNETEPVVDLAGAVASLGGSWEAFCDVGQEFLNHMQDLRPRWDAGYATVALLQAAVHEAGSSLGAVGAVRAHHLARRIEDRLRRGEPLTPDTLPGLVDTIDAAVAAIRQAMAGEPPV